MNMGANTAPFIPKLVTFTRAWVTAWASSKCRKAPGRKSGKAI